MDSNIRRDYHDTQNNKTLVVSFGYYDRYFTIPTFDKTSNILYLKDPFGFLFYKGLSDVNSTGTQDDVEKLIQNEINTIKPTTVIFTATCVNSILACILGFKLQADQVIVFNPWTHVGEEIASLSSCAIGRVKNVAIERKIRPAYTTNDEFHNFVQTSDLNNWIDKVGKTKVTMYFGNTPMDDLSEKHLNPALIEKFTILRLNQSNRIQNIRIP